MLSSVLDPCTREGGGILDAATLARAEPQSTRWFAPRTIAGSPWSLALQSRLRGHPHPPHAHRERCSGSGVSPALQSLSAAMPSFARRATARATGLFPSKNHVGREVGGGVQSKFRERPRRPSDRPRSGPWRALGLRPSERTCVHVPSDFPRSRKPEESEESAVASARRRGSQIPRTRSA